MESRHAPLGGSEKQSQTANSPALKVMWLTFALGAQFATPCIWAQAPQVRANPGQAEAAPLRGAARTLDAPTIKAYPVESGDLTVLQDRLREQYRGRSEVRISADSRTKQLLVVAPEAEQAAISQWLAAGAPLATGANAGGRTLQNISWRQLENGLRRAGAVPTASSATAAEVQYRVTVGPGEQADLFVNRDTGGLRFVGTANGEAVLQRLVDLLDRSPRGPEETSQLVSFTKAEPAKVHRVLTEIQAARRPTHPLAARPEHIGEMLTMVFQEGGQAAPAAPPAAAPPAAGNAPGGEGSLSVEEALGKILGNVQIEFVEGLDLLLVRGKQKDVERVLKIIEEIERQSVSTRPEVEVYFLKHVDGESLNLLIQSVYTQVFTARQGTVSITPLVKPNALLMIGRKENLEPIKQLIAKLDQPVDPETQLKVFRLKSLPAVDAESKLRNFFTATPGQGITPRTGLGVRVKIIADFRSNSLIVQASPRDLEEIGKLLDQIDADESSVVNEVRVIRLQNTLAEELAPILVETLTGIRQAGAGGQGQQGGPQQQQQQPGGGAGGQGGNTQASSSLKAISLQFLQSNGQGSELIKSGILADVRINADGRSNSVILNAPPKSMDLLEALIRQLDSLPATEAQIKVFTIVNGDATTLSTMLRELFGQQQNQQGGNQFNQNATGSGDNTLVPLRFSVDTRTNSIIASGSTGDLQVVYKILVRLDEGDIRERVTTVYRLRYAPALDVATALTNLLTNQRQVNQLAPNLQSAFEQLDREVIVVPEAVSNSLLVSATPRYYEEMKKTIEDLDRRPPMVVIQVLLAEVTLGDIDQFGVELGLQDSLLFNRSLLPAGGVGSPGFNFNNQPLGNAASAASLATRNNVAAQGLSNFSLGRSDGPLGYGGLVLSASSESVSVLIRALQQSSRLQVLSRPQVQTLDNQPAYIQVGQQVPRVTSVNVTAAGFSNGTELVDTGVILGVTPRTSTDGTIVMEIDAVKSAVGPENEGIVIASNGPDSEVRSPKFDITRAQTTVSARSGQTVILGGLITKNQTEQTRRVPYISDIPVLGRLFRFDSTITERRELLIIMTPYLMTSEEQQTWLNMRESERMNWCLADVYSIHGDAERFTSAGPCNPENTSPLIFPDDNPAALGPTPTPVQTPSGNPPELLPLNPAGGVELPPTPSTPLPPKPGLLPRPTSAPLAPQQIQAAAPMGPLGPGPSPAVYQQQLLPPGAQTPPGVAPASFQPTTPGQPPFSFQPAAPQSSPAAPVYPPFPPPPQQAAFTQPPVTAQTRAGEKNTAAGMRPSAQFSPPPPPALYGAPPAAP